MPLTDFYEVRDKQQHQGQEVLNVYHFRRGVASPSAASVGQAYIDSILPALLPLQSASVQRSVIEVENFGDPTDFATIDSVSQPGTRVGVALPALLAATIQLNRTRNDIRNGMKRFDVGVETDITGANWDLAFLTLLQTLADTLVSPIELASAPGVSQGFLVVLKRFCTTTPSPPCLGGYRLPNTDAEIDNFNYQPTSGTARRTVRSQVSRKSLV